MKEILVTADGRCHKAIKDNVGCAFCTGNKKCEQYDEAKAFLRWQNKISKQKGA